MNNNNPKKNMKIKSSKKLISLFINLTPSSLKYQTSRINSTILKNLYSHLKKINSKTLNLKNILPVIKNSYKNKIKLYIKNLLTI